MYREQLNKDLTIDILSRLPVKSLTRFRCVRKSWYTLFSNPIFIFKHLNQSKNDASLFIKHRCCITQKHVICLVSSSDSFDVLSSFEVPSEMYSKFMRIVGSCNGLLCITHDGVSNFDSPVFLWNPATREFRDLPKCIIETAHMPGERVCGVVYGFGYNPIIDDYKLVRIVYSYYFDRLYSRVEVFQLGDCFWREINAINCRIYESSCTMANGILHWIAHGGGVNDCELVVSFDMGDEVFRQIILPDFDFVGNGICMRLAVFKESLSLITYTYRGRDKWFDIWVKNENSAKEVWTKQLTIGPVFGVERPLGCGMWGEVFMEKSKGRLVWYDPTTQEIRDHSIHGVSCSLEVHVYVESLVSVYGRNEVVEVADSII
ncbi:FBA_1 domain-containing protein [Cephalotus follicularis]|uniref:FBA_1 domain-containing protein n=1 Tax=Cephalotus follicularis TaxID=3775 RepID=A0A1Q3AZH9_CEPFO|nr:FBA_1 domain-containing protein [Cephalotus follicularis]